MAEKAPWDFAKETGLDAVVINPGTVMGPIIPPTVNASMSMLIHLIQGNANFYTGPVHVKDVALAYILLYENPSASGRHLCVEAIRHYGDFAGKVAELYPVYNVPRIPKDTQPELLRTEDGSKKLMDLGIQFNYLVVSNAYSFYSFFRLS
ncbi:hypothetical protein MKW92_037618 [Papaver armeniacum]|nr:hypothetical protein MKW92_037618 [Papaver armeniacum]